jgi:Zn-dependent metalloprotease
MYATRYYIFLHLNSLRDIYCMCNIIPRKILENIAKNETDDRKKAMYEHTLNIGDKREEDLRDKRKRIQSAIRKGEDPKVSLERDHIEHLKVYDNRYQWEYNKSRIWEDFKQDHTTSAIKVPRRIFTKSLDKVHDVFHDLMERHSYDGENAVVQCFLKFGRDYVNAFWDGEYLAFGTGDKTYFNDFSKIYDVVAHEFGHAVQQYESNLEYYGQAGALNEHISDVFGIVAYQLRYNISVTSSKWLIGEKLFTKRVNAKALRSFKDELAYDDPIIGTDDQPKFMKDFVVTDEDEGGVHINSGIPNHAFYLFNKKLGGNSWENGSFLIWYNTQLKSTGLSEKSTFKEFATATLRIAENMELGPDVNLVQKLGEAWSEVGVL